MTQLTETEVIRIRQAAWRAAQCHPTKQAITEIDTGRKVTMAGTDWPVTVQVYRWRRGWVAAEVCNGIALSTLTRKTKREAMEAAREL